ncbi:UNVERIFIED_CONTAM: hypothetical protein PYX00_000666 [Menopon gallinae]|uniref:Uncharacterized protein n=1 Tax=Menopon gallinae TaxID=328185 RepID=A0AAW2I9H2_9NEOP
MTAAEMWSPATWYYPYGIAAAEAWAEYLKNSQQVTNQLYQQWHATGAANGWYQQNRTGGYESMH